MNEAAARRDREVAAPARSVGRAIAHDSAEKHVAGAALYTDDMPEPAGTLHVVPILSPAAKGRMVAADFTKVSELDGVVAVLTAADIPGRNDCSPVDFDVDPIFAGSDIAFHGQVVGAVVAGERMIARRAARLARIEVAAETPVVTAAEALAQGSRVMADYAFRRGDATAGMETAPRRVTGSLSVGGQEHFYLEGQVAFAIPREDGDMLVYSSTQHPSEVQHVVAQALGLAAHSVDIEVRRMGGGFGGKESQASQWAAIAAIAARVTGRPCKLRLDRDDDMILTGKRHDCLVDYALGFDDEGVIAAARAQFAMRCGYSADLSLGVCDRTLFHADNAYYLPACELVSLRLRTNTVSNTAFRGFGGPQGMVAIEKAVDDIARLLQLDPLDIRKRNLYRPDGDMTPYGMKVDDNILPELVATLEATSDYRARRRDIEAFNARSPILKRGLALSPVKFGISFTLIHLNQAGALVHVYNDGSVALNHGGTEMGQGLYVKVAQVVADEFGLPLSAVKITATTTAKVPNTAPTAASAGTDLNAMAAQAAARSIKQRMAGFLADKHGIEADDVRFAAGEVHVGSHRCSFAEAARQAVLARVSLSSTGFYRTPDIHWDRAATSGRPFFYFAYGAACSEVEIDITTGEMKVRRVDVLHDVGTSLNPAIDIGQIEGGFVQGMGWLTTEELVFDAEGRLRTHAPSTYKIPLASDVPADFRVALWNGANRQDTIYRSKAVGEPPLMLAISVWLAIADAVHATAPGKPVALDAPATPEAILRAIDAQRQAGERP